MVRIGFGVYFNNECAETAKDTAINSSDLQTIEFRLGVFSVGLRVPGVCCCGACFEALSLLLLLLLLLPLPRLLLRLPYSAAPVPTLPPTMLLPLLQLLVPLRLLQLLLQLALPPNPKPYTLNPNPQP